MDFHLYPTSLSRDRFVREAARQRGVLFDHRHFTYPEFLERLYRAQGWLRRPIDAAAQSVFVRYSLSTVLDKTPSPGLVSEYRGLIDELKGAGLEVAEFERCVRVLAPEISPNTRATLPHLLEIFRCYQSCLAQAGLVDHGDRDLAVFTALRGHLAEGTKPAFVRDVQRIILHDVYQLSLVHYALVSVLIQLVEEGGVVQHFSDGLNVDAVRFAEFTWQRFVADERLAAHVLPEWTMPRRRGANLEALSARLFTSAPQGEFIEPDGTLMIVAAPGRAREVEVMARHVRELLSQGVSPEQIAIVVRNLDQYGELLESVLRRYRIPAWFRRGIPLFHLPLIKTLFSALELAGSTYPRKALLKLLTSSYLRQESDWPEDIVGLVDGVGYLDHSHATLPSLLDDYVRRHAPEGEGLKKVGALVEGVEALQTALDGLASERRTFLAYLEALKSVLGQFGFFRALGMHPDVPLHVLQRDREALRLTFETLRAGAEALRLLGDSPLEFAEFCFLARDLLHEVTLDQPRRDDGAVRVLGVRDILGLDFDHVLVPGLADTQFPLHHTEHPVLDDAARHTLNRAAQVVLAEKFAGVLDRRLLAKALLTSAEQAREEPLLFFLALESANRSCLLSYPARTSEGETVFPSMFVDEVLRHFHHPQDRLSLLTRVPAVPSVPAPAHCLEPGELVRHAALAWRTGVPSMLDDALCAQGIMVERLRQLAKTEGARKRYLLSSASRGEIDPAPYGDIGREVDLHGRFLDPRHPWSPTMLEDAAACPFAFFARYALGLMPRVEPDYDVSSLVLGELAHDILAEFFTIDPSHDSRTAVRRMRLIAEQVLALRYRRPGMGHPGFWKVRKAELIGVLEDVAAYAAERRKEGYQTCYREDDLSGVVPCGPWSVWLKGRVDRVAIREGPAGITAVQVQDFKYSGNVDRYRSLLKPEALGQWSFQLPVYLYLTLQQLMRDGRPLAAEADLLLEYLLLKDPGRKAWTVEVSRAFIEPDRSGGLFDGMRQVIAQAIAGRFAPRPAEGKKTCTYCPYNALCRYWTSGAGMESEVNESMGQ